MKSSINVDNLQGLKKSDDSILLFLLGEGMVNGYLTFDQVLELSSEKQKRLVRLLVDRGIQLVDDESEIGECKTCPGCKKAKSVKFAFYYAKPFQPEGYPKCWKGKRVLTDHCVLCLDETICECPSCRTPKPLKNFYHVWKRGTIYTRSQYCEECHDWACRSEKRYRISALELLEKRAAQGPFCPICRRLLTNRNLRIDHCHHSEEVRGLLCSKCNPSLGHFNDNFELLRAAALYLEPYAISKK